MKRHLFLLVALLPMVASAYDAQINGIYYNFISENEAEVTYKTTSYNSYSGSIFIPPSVNYNGKTYSVTSIGEYAFANSNGLFEVTIPNSVTTIGWYAFANCSLLSVTIPESVTSIGKMAFYGCYYLANIEVTHCLTEIFSDAFYETAWFDNQPRGIVYLGNVVCTYKYKSDMPEGTRISLPEGTIGIVDYAFEECSGLTSVTIPNSVTTIGRFAFYFCTNLTSVVIGSGVTSIGNMAFYYDSNITDVWCFAENVPSTGLYVFGDQWLAPATLHVPEGSLEAYRTTAPWSDFGTIVALTQDDIDAVDEVKASETTAETARYDLLGRQISTPQKGINIIRMNDGTNRKVLIK